jgi:hypothetical protein
MKICTGTCKHKVIGPGGYCSFKRDDLCSYDPCFDNYCSAMQKKTGIAEQPSPSVFETKGWPTPSKAIEDLHLYAYKNLMDKYIHKVVKKQEDILLQQLNSDYHNHRVTATEINDRLHDPRTLRVTLKSWIGHLKSISQPTVPTAYVVDILENMLKLK